MSNGRGFQPRLLALLGTVLLVGLILGAVGGSQYSEKTPPGSHNTLIQVSVILYLVGFAGECLVTLYSFANYRVIIPGDHRILIAVALSLPFLAVRIIYSLISVFGDNPDFNSFSGSVIIFALMAVMEEFIIVILYLAAGLLAPKIQRHQVQPGLRKDENQESYGLEQRN